MRVKGPWRLISSMDKKCACVVIPPTVVWHQSLPHTFVHCGSCFGPELQQHCDVLVPLVSTVLTTSMEQTAEVSISKSLSSGTRLLAVRAAAYHPLPVCLDLHRAPCETVGVKQQVAGFCLDILPVASTRRRCEEHKHGFQYKSN